ncbi:metallophosphoesterase family protein [Ramlibacter sp. USB13]|uniref:Metallophosphoesterase family protein n=1 Tax=Ramlibacter cellulosilyticus TaxID=2764187 RepID=A0A923MS19_9BURK|nr:metallophosphoesterase [Ramlibacter cellulosilyticus]MBC5784430.1 metallophosphoesterase family protein [Ramlibacter cellulosilyticus]
MAKSASTVRFAAVGDLHVTKDAGGTLRALFAQAAEAADALLLCGDLTDYGTAEEAHVLAEELSVVKVPIVAVLGNHDFESGTPEVVVEALTKAGVRVLDGEACEIEGVGIAGIKGFAGGFGRGSLGAWGEPAIKMFVQEALHEAMKLESALAKLRTPRKIALLHYSPIAGTVAGEPVEIFPFLGSSRLEEPLLRYPVDAVFHGHAHRGTLEAKTINGVPVFNVARPLLLRSRPDEPAFRLFELAREAPEATPPASAHAQHAPTPTVVQPAASANA